MAVGLSYHIRAPQAFGRDEYATQGSNPGLADPRHACYSHVEASPWTVDTTFYSQPRMIHHIDEEARRTLQAHYRTMLPKGGAVLDLMSSWTSHPIADTYSSEHGLRLPAAWRAIRREAQGSFIRRGFYCTYAVRVPASGVPYVPFVPWHHRSHLAVGAGSTREDGYFRRLSALGMNQVELRSSSSSSGSSSRSSSSSSSRSSSSRSSSSDLDDDLVMQESALTSVLTTPLLHPYYTLTALLLHPYYAP